MKTQVITPELRRWIIEQASAGHSPESILTAMEGSGWDEEVALAALDETIHAYAREVQAAQKAMPEVQMPAGSSRVWVHDREVAVVVSLKRPRVVVFADFLSSEECEAMIELSKPKLARSETVETTTGGSEVNVARTSRGMFFTRGEHELCARIEARIEALLNWPVDRGEGLQVLHYSPGAEYKPHYDYFDPEQSGTAAVLRRGGQRVGTLVMYLNTPKVGGATVFPDAGLEVSALAGHAVFFSYGQPNPSTLTLHGGAPVVEGEKWVATKWLREQRFD
ncbi:MAG: 2OG-Fe(II) oxygenase [Pseudomonadota bacterium]